MIRFLIIVRLATLVFGLLMTRILFGHFSLQDYDTYLQIMLLTSIVSNLTMLGMMDGVNFFFCKESDEAKRNRYVSIIFFAVCGKCACGKGIITLHWSYIKIF